MEEKIKIIALFGMSCSGKDFLKKTILKEYPDTFHGIVHTTTRPKRDYEINRVDYHFLDVETFAESICNGNIIEAQNFNGWGYGTDIRNLKPKKINIGIFSPEAIRQILSDDRFDVRPIWVLTPDKVRLQRALEREENPNCHEICRRFLSDEKDFDDIDFDFKTVSGTMKNSNDYDFNIILNLFGQNE